MTINVTIHIKVPDDDTEYTLTCRGLREKTVEDAFCEKYGFDEVPECTTFSPDCESIDWKKLYADAEKELSEREARYDEEIKKLQDAEDGL